MKTKERKATFLVFKDIIEIVVNMDQLSKEDKEEYLNDWFELYKDVSYSDVIEWAKFHFAEVNGDTHDFWLDKRGLMIFELKGMLAVTGIFPTF